MKKQLKKAFCSLLLGTILFHPYIPGVKSACVITSQAHQGRTDALGGHHDYKNASGLGSYHYHCGGHPAHLHPNGVCPYGAAGADFSNGSGSAQSSAADQTQNAAAAEPEVTLGWQKDGTGWWYRDSSSTYLNNGLFPINGSYYYFNPDGYMVTGWKEIDGHWYYFDGSGQMVTGVYYIDGSIEYFDSDGKWDKSYFDEEYSRDEYDDWDDD